jgi:hypothetical protein
MAGRLDGRLDGRLVGRVLGSVHAARPNHSPQRHTPSEQSSMQPAVTVSTP